MKLFQSHYMLSPVEDVDFFYHMGQDAYHTPRRPIIITQDPVSDLTCARCPWLETRLFSFQQLERHLFEKYVSYLLEPLPTDAHTLFSIDTE